MPKQAGNRGRGNQGGANRGGGNPASAAKGRGNKANQAAARAKVAEMRAREAARKRRRNWLVGIGAAVVVIVAAVAITLAVTSSGKSPSAAGGTPKLRLASLSTLGTLKPAPAPGPKGPEGVPVPAGTALASTATGATGKPVNGISCDTSEQLVFHIHAHLTVFVNGAARQVPAGIGIAGAQAQNTPAGPFIATGTCFYWLHTHAADGIIHIESPVHRTFTLGNLFDIWGQPLGTGQVGPARGPVTAIYNGQVYLGNPRDIPLRKRAQIQLQVGKPLVAPVSISFPGGL